jgi:hypothetical protein
MKKGLILTTLVIMVNVAFAAPQKMSAQDQYAPLCIDLARRIVTDKVGFYQSVKKSQLKTRKTASASKLKFEQLPHVVNHKTDKKVISLILKSIQDKKAAKNFTQKLDAEDNLIQGIAKLMKFEGKPFMNHCVSLYNAAEKKCNAFISKDFNKFTSCLSSITSENSVHVSKFVPYVNFKNKSRQIASKSKKRVFNKAI